jgi:hypothetical protein
VRITPVRIIAFWIDSEGHGANARSV